MNKPLALIACLLLSLAGAPAALADESQAEIRFFAEPVETLWVGEQATLNLELWSDGFSFRGQTFALPEVKGAFLMQPDATTVKLSERRGGATWQGLRYPLLLFAQREGRLVVPPFDVSFEVSAGFGQPVSKFQFRTPPLNVEARLPPGVRPGELLVTSSAVDFESSWTPQPAGDEPLQLKVGDALSLRVDRSAERVPGMVFPPLPVFEVEGLAAYPDKPRVADRVDRGALVGTRSDSITYVCEREGRYEIPAIRFQWWDPQREVLSEQLIEAVTVEVVPNPAFGAGPAPGASADELPARRIGIWETLGGAILALALFLFPGGCGGPGSKPGKPGPSNRSGAPAAAGMPGKPTARSRPGWAGSAAPAASPPCQSWRARSATMTWRSMHGNFRPRCWTIARHRGTARSCSRRWNVPGAACCVPRTAAGASAR